MPEIESQQSEFYLDDEPLEWPVAVTLPANGGKFVTTQFTGLFSRLSGEEIDALTGREQFSKEIDAALEAKDSEALARLEKEMHAKQIEITPRILVGWSAVKRRPGGADVPFTADVLQAQLRGHNGKALLKGIWQALGEIRQGYRLGNSEPLPNAGQPSAQAEEPTL